MQNVKWAGFGFHTESQKLCYDRVRDYGRALFGDSFEERGADTSFSLAYGSAIINVKISPYLEDDASITVIAWVITDVELKSDLLDYLLHENYDVRFGGFGIDEDGDIYFENTIVGSTCDENEFRASILAVASTADDYDDYIQNRWGGERAIE